MKFVDENSRILNWPEMPLARVVILFILGVYASNHFSLPIIYQISTCLFLFTVVCVIHHSDSSVMTVVRWNSIMILILIFCLGFLRYSLQKPYNDKYHYTNRLDLQSNYIVGQIIEDIKKKKASSSSLLAVESINGESCRGKLLIYFNKMDTLLDYNLGDVIAISGVPRDIQSGKNPRSFDYRGYMANKGIEKQIFLRAGSHSLIRRDQIFFPLHYAHQARKWALEVLNIRLPNREEFATASAMVLGNREHISDELQAAFSDTGAVHVLAVSGLHVGIVIMLFNFLFRRTRSESKQYKKVIKFSVLTLVVIAYALITGASPAVVRASIMFSTLLFGRLWFDNTNIYNVLSFSALLILLYNPNNLTDLGFIFSYLALISIVFFQPYFMDLIEKFYEPTHWLSIRIVQLVSVSLAAQILIFPMSIHYFHTFPVYFILSGVMAVAMAPFILGCGLVMIFTSFIPVWIDAIAILFSLLLRFFLGIIYGIQMLPFNSVDNVWISKSSMILIYIIILAVMYLMTNKKTEYQRFLNPKNTARNTSVLISFAAVFGIMLNSIYQTYKVKNHCELIIHDIGGSTLIDIYEGEELYTVESIIEDRTKIKYANRDNRIFHGSPSPSQIEIDSNLTTNTMHLTDNGLLIYKNKVLLFLHLINLEGPFPAESDILVLSHNCDIAPYDILKVHVPSEVVVDSSVPYKTVNQWKKECSKLNISFYDIRKQGAYIIK